MSPSGPRRSLATGDDSAIFLLVAASEPSPQSRPHPPVEVFTSEGVAREAFQRLRLESSGSAWGQLVAVEDQAVRPLCWFGRSPGPLPAPRRRAWRPRRRCAVGALAVSIAAVGWVWAGFADRAGAALAPHVSRTALATVTASQRAEATAVNTSDGCHRMEIWLIDGDGHTVASDASSVCPGKHLSVAYSPSSAVRVRSVVALHRAPPAIVDPARHSFEVRDLDRGRTSVVVPAQPGCSR